MITSRRAFLKTAAVAATIPAIPGLVRPVWAQELPLVRFAGAAPVIRPDHAWQFLGIPMGYYEQMGFRGDYIPTAGSAAAVQLVLTGQAEVANSGLLELIAAKTRQPDLPVHMYYSQERQSSYEIIVPIESPITQLSDLAGQRVGVPSLASGALAFARGLLRTAGVDPETVEFLPIGVGAQALAAIDGEEVVAFSVFSGSIAAMEVLGREFRSFTAPIAGAGMVMADSFVRENHDLAVSIFRGFAMNQQIMLRDAEATVRAFWAAYDKPDGNGETELRNGAHFVRRTSSVFQSLDDPRLWGYYTPEEWVTTKEFFGGPEGAIPEDAELSTFYSDILVEEGNQIDQSLIDDAIARFAG
ncbi:ABC transporter substrate-binding protein [Amorphus sp. MBR-141]